MLDKENTIFSEVTYITFAEVYVFLNDLKIKNLILVLPVECEDH